MQTEAGATGRAGVVGRGRAFRVRCFECGVLNGDQLYRCVVCGGPLVLEGEPARCIAAAHVAAGGIWQWRDLLPQTSHLVSLGEANTPLIGLPDKAVQSSGTVALKLESLNPTLSFKDRAMALGSSIARDRHGQGLVLASTGNAAVSAAAYAARAAMRCRVFVGAQSGAGTKLDAMRGYGAEVQMVDGDYSDAYAAAAECEAQGWLNVTTTYRNPFLAEAYRTIAYELFEQLGAAPDTVIVPVGAGPLLRGILSGFLDLLDSGQAARLPRMIGVQAVACAPLVDAWRSVDWRASLAGGATAAPTAAGAIADPLRGYENEGLLTLAAVSRSGGEMVAVDEGEIVDAMARLAQDAGVAAEPAAAAALAALPHIDVIDERTPGATVLLITGHGARNPGNAALSSDVMRGAR